MSNQRLQISTLAIWFVAALGVPYQFVLQSTPNLMIPILIEDFHIDRFAVGFLTSSFFYTYLLFQVPAGFLIDRFGARRVLTCSIFFAAITCLLFANTHHLGCAELSRLAMGLAAAPCVPAIMYIAAKRFPPQNFVILAGVAESMGMLGGAIGEAALGEVVVHSNWRMTMVACCVLGVLLGALMILVIKDKRDDTHHTTLHTKQFKQIWVGFGQVMQNSQIWIIVVYGGLVFAALPALAGLWVVPALQDRYHVSLELAALGSSALFLGTAFGLLFWGWVSEKWRKRRPSLFIATTLDIFLMVLFVYLSNLSIVLVFCLLLLIGFVSAVYVLAFALVRENTKEGVRASAMGLTNMMSMVIGAPLLQPLIGAILQRYDIKHVTHVLEQSNIAYTYALSTVVLCLIVALILVFFIRETNCQQQS